MEVEITQARKIEPKRQAHQESDLPRWVAASDKVEFPGLGRE